MHMAVGLMLLFMYLVLGKAISFWFMLGIFVMGSWFQMQLRRGKNMPMIENTLRFFETENEAENWRGFGAQTLVLGIMLTFLFFPAYAAIPAVLVVTFADAASAIFGTYFPSAEILDKRTIFGSTSFFIAALVVLQFFVNMPLALFIALSATLIELIPLPDDNVWIPFGTALLLTFLIPMF
jgi:dolichol kinase